MFIGFSIKEIALKVLMGLVLLYGVYEIGKTIYITEVDDTCRSMDSGLFSSPDGKWHAKAQAVKCTDSPEKISVYLLTEPEDKFMLLIYSSVYESKVRMNIDWKSSDELVISIPDTVTPDFPSKEYLGVNVSYSVY